MRVLYIIPCWPQSRSFGGQLRALHIGRALQEVGEVTIAVVSSDIPEPGCVTASEAEFCIHGHIPVVTTSHRGFRHRAQWYLDPRFMDVHGCGADAHARNQLLSRLSEFDLVWVLNSRTPNLLQQWRWPGAVLDLDDVARAALEVMDPELRQPLLELREHEIAAVKGLALDQAPGVMAHERLPGRAPPGYLSR